MPYLHPYSGKEGRGDGRTAARSSRGPEGEEKGEAARPCGEASHKAAAACFMIAVPLQDVTAAAAAAAMLQIKSRSKCMNKRMIQV